MRRGSGRDLDVTVAVAILAAAAAWGVTDVLLRPIPWGFDTIQNAIWAEHETGPDRRWEPPLPPGSGAVPSFTPELAWRQSAPFGPLLVAVAGAMALALLGTGRRALRLVRGGRSTERRRFHRSRRLLLRLGLVGLLLGVAGAAHAETQGLLALGELGVENWLGFDRVTTPCGSLLSFDVGLGLALAGVGLSLLFAVVASLVRPVTPEIRHAALRPRSDARLPARSGRSGAHADGSAWAHPGCARRRCP